APIEVTTTAATRLMRSLCTSRAAKISLQRRPRIGICRTATLTARLAQPISMARMPSAIFASSICLATYHRQPTVTAILPAMIADFLRLKVLCGVGADCSVDATDASGDITGTALPFATGLRTASHARAKQRQRLRKIVNSVAGGVLAVVMGVRPEQNPQANSCRDSGRDVTHPVAH